MLLARRYGYSAMMAVITHCCVLYIRAIDYDITSLAIEAGSSVCARAAMPPLRHYSHNTLLLVWLILDTAAGAITLRLRD